MIVVAWIIFSIVAGVVGSGRNIGFWGAFLLSLLLSPLIGLIIAFASARSEPEKATLINPVNSTINASVTDELTKLKKLMDDGVITKDEFDMQKYKLLTK